MAASRARIHGRRRFPGEERGKMKREKIRLIVRWHPDTKFAMPLHRNVPTARRLPEFWPDVFLRLEEEAWRFSAPLR
jgi:hypothetical protein